VAIAKRIELPRHLVPVALCYEAVAILTPLPTLSAIIRHHRVLAAPLLIGLAIHLLHAPVVIVVAS
jgi:hypothetical protein